MPSDPQLEESAAGGAVAAVVVNYRSAPATVACVASLRGEGVEEIVVVDSASGDDVAARLAEADPGVRLVALTRNRGYGAAANAGAAATSALLVLLCNADVVVRPGTVSALVDAAARRPQVGAFGPRIERPDGSRYPSARAFPSVLDAAGHGFLGLVNTDNPFSRRYLRTGGRDDTDNDAPTSVDWVSGACVLLRRAAFSSVGGFDESYFMFVEEVDLCWRLRRAGWEVSYEPGGCVTHEEGLSRASAPYRMIAAHHWSLWRFGWRTTTGRDRRWLPLVAVGLVIRAGLLGGRRLFLGR